ncbi:MAG: sulfotransferase family protein [Acidimicrobiia bacterium]
MTETETKILGVGMHKTGTKSFANALRTLGYRVTGPFGVNDRNTPDTTLRHALNTLEEYDAAQDNPWPFLYREIDAAYPGSKFILTYREPEAWIQSVVRHFGGKSTPMREWIYGVGDPRGNEERYLEVYENHNRTVSAYFADRPNDFMTLRVGDNDGWPALCQFLGVAEPTTPFPHSNSERQRRRRRSLVHRLAHALPGSGSLRG